MIDGPGGYVNHRLTVPLPSLYDTILIGSLVALVLELWLLWTRR